MNIINWLNEGLENKYFKEDLAHDRTKYPQLMGEENDELFNKLLEADPTYRKGSNKKGKYLDWIVKVYTNYKKNNPSLDFRFQHCFDVLKQFEKQKALAVGSVADISKFNTLEELESFLADDTKFREWDDTVARENFHTVDLNDPKNAELIIDNDDYQVWSPKNYAASVKLGRGTKWCTAYSNDRSYYDEYTSQAPLYIFIPKRHPDDKYQLCAYRRSARDKYDDPVPLYDFPEEVYGLVDEDEDAMFERLFADAKKLIDSAVSSVTYDSICEMIESLEDLLDDEDEYGCENEIYEYACALTKKLTEKLNSDHDQLDRESITDIIDIVSAVSYRVSDMCFNYDSEDISIALDKAMNDLAKRNGRGRIA